MKGKCSLKDDIAEVLVTEEELAAKVAELGAQISSDYKVENPLLVCILKGGFMFLADLIRHITVPVGIDFMAISSYGSGTETSGEVRILKDLDEPIEGRHVLIIEDIIDSGLSLEYILRVLGERKPASLRICVLLNKIERRIVEISLGYVGLHIPDKFVVGYGLDFDQKYRNLPFVGVLKEEFHS